jgi:predicted Zn-dependent peptidase
MMFGDHPLSRRIHGDPENVAALELPDVTNDVKNLFRESPCLVYAITDRQGKDVADLVRGQLSLEPRAALSKGRFKMPPRHQRAQTRRGARPLAQSRLAMGFRIADYSRRSDRFAAYMGDFILGGGSTSRLFKVIREKHSLAYSIGSSFDDASGTIYVSAGLDPSTEGRVRKLVGAQVKRLAKHGPTAEETSLALTGFQQSLIGFQDSQDQLIAFDSAQRLKGQKVRTPEQVMASHRRVRPEQVTDLVSRLKLDSVFVLGPNGETS